MKNLQNVKKVESFKNINENIDSYTTAELRDLVLQMAANIEQKDNFIQYMLDQVRLQQQRMYGRKSERIEVINGQIQFEFNDIEAEADPSIKEPEIIEENTERKTKKKRKSRCRIPKVCDFETHLELTETELNEKYGINNWKELPPEVSFKAHFKPQELVYEKVVRHKYASNDNETIVRANLRDDLLPKSMATPSLVSHLVVAKFQNAMPLYRLEKEFKQFGLPVTRATMGNWLLNVYDIYLKDFISVMKDELLKYTIIEADETPVQINKDGRRTGAKSYMWVYRTNVFCPIHIVLYDAQKTREAEHAIEFLESFTGIVVCDGFIGYDCLSKQNENVILQRCWVHVKRKVADIIKSSKKGKTPKLALEFSNKISKIFYTYNRLVESVEYKHKSEEDQITDLHLHVKPLVDEFFEFLKDNYYTLPARSKTGEAFSYALNQEETLRTFLDHPNVPMDSNAAEQAIRPFTTGRRNWVMIDTIRGAKASAAYYSIIETAKANHLNTHKYMTYMLEQLPIVSKSNDKSEYLRIMPWSDSLPKEIYENPYKDKSQDNK